MNQNKYSVIIPACNAEKTIRRCLDSLLEQGRQDVEILLVSDGSTDGTDAIALEYGHKIRFFRQPHSGVSAARNVGLCHARGTYVTFVDSDDFVTADYFAVLDQAPDCDFLAFGAGDCTATDPLGKLIATRKIMSPCTKRLRRSFLEAHSLRFPEGLQVGEDFSFCMACAMKADRVEVSAGDIYRADISNPNSLSRRYRPDLDATMARVFAQIAGLEGAEIYGDLLDFLYVKQAVACIAEEYKQVPPSRQRVAEICDRFREPIGSTGGLMHYSLRWLLAHGRGVLWLGAYLGKGWRFKKCRK